MPEKPFWKRETNLVLILIGTCLLLYFFRLGSIPLRDIDEATHAATSKDMVLSGDWITPQYNGENFFDKPPLYNWLVAFSMVLFGFTELAARLPSALLGLGSVMVTYWLARKMFDPVAAFLSALVLATSAGHVVLSRVVVHDICLAFFVTLALALFFIGYKNERRSKPAFLCGYAAAGFAVLAKGPVGIVLPAIIIALFLIYKKRLGYLRKMQPGWGLLILMAIVAPWYMLISMRHPDYLAYFILKQNIGSFFSQQSRHPEPFYYYLPFLMGGLFPWSLFLPLALFRAIRAKGTLHGDGIIFALIWFSVIFVFFSIASSKLGTYILPLYPAASVLLAALWHDLLYASDRVVHKGVVFSYFPFAVMMPLALIYLVLFPAGYLKDVPGLSVSLVFFLAAWASGAGLLSTGLAIKRKYRAFIASIAGMSATLFILVLIYVAPIVGPLISCKELALELDGLMAPGESVRFYRRARSSFLFYTDRSARLLRSPQQFMDYMASAEQVYCVIKYDEWKDIDNSDGALQVVARVGDKLIISNKKTDG